MANLWQKNFEYYRREPFKPGFKISVIVLLALFLGAIILITVSYLNFSKELGAITNSYIDEEVRKPPPVYTKGIYLTGWTAGGRIEEFIDLIRKTELNTVVIDVKDYTGKVAFDSDIKLVNDLDLEEKRIPNLEKLIRKLHKENIYVIIRITVFQDPELAEKRPDLALKNKWTGKIWRDRKGLGWLDPASREVWNYHVLLAQEVARAGADEINLDYIRFPSDGDLSSISYPFWDGKTSKYEVIRRFYRYLDRRMRNYPVYISADLFGLTLWKGPDDDLGIGQRFQDTIPYFDYICPMVYPSHFRSGFEGFKNPAEYPYEVIYRSIESAKKLHGENIKNKIRPWLQDFDMGAEYTAEMIKKEKQAVYDAGAFGWILWNSKNEYTEGALEDL